jgi:hypothetical protein
MQPFAMARNLWYTCMALAFPWTTRCKYFMILFFDMNRHHGLHHANIQ